MIQRLVIYLITETGVVYKLYFKKICRGLVKQ